MDGIKALVVITAIAGSLYYVKNIKLSVSGAQAVVVEEVLSEDTAASDIEEDHPQQMRPSREVNDTAVNVTPSDPLGLHDKMVSLIRSQKICELLDFVNTNNVNKKDQFKALGDSFSTNQFAEVDVFLGGDFEEYGKYKSDYARAYLLAKEIGAFEEGSFKRKNEFSKGLIEKDKLYLEKLNSLAKQDSSNLYYTFFRNEVYNRYKGLDDEAKGMLFDQVMATTRYESPVLSTVRSLYQTAKNNIAQFYLALPIFELALGIDHTFASRSIWYIYDENMRYHINGLLQKNIEMNSDSAKIFGYEPGIYKSYRNSLHYEEYQDQLETHEYDKIRTQPVYSLEELKPDFSKGCTPPKVLELETKLRAL